MNTITMLLWTKIDLFIPETRKHHTPEYISLYTSVSIKLFDVESMREFEVILLRKKADFFSPLVKKKGRWKHYFYILQWSLPWNIVTLNSNGLENVEVEHKYV